MKKIIIWIIIIIAICLIGLFFLPDKTPSDNLQPNDQSSNQDDQQDDIVCTLEYDPVCGSDNKTYGNSCEADRAQVEIIYKGECDPNKILFENLNTDAEFSLFCVNTNEAKEFVINSNDEYLQLTEYISDHQNCTDYNLVEIDFSKYTLLGKYLTGTGCEVDFDRNIYKDDLAKEIIYEITIQTEGFCEMLVSSMNWVLIPKIPQDYDVQFKVIN